MDNKLVTFNNVMMALLTMAVSWLAYTVQDSTIKMATMTEKINQLENKTQLFTQITYTLRDAQKDFELRDTVMANMGARITQLEKER